jgi:hypothetical protein
LRLVLAVIVGALVLGFAQPATAQSIPGPLKVTDSGPSGEPGYAIKGITGFQNDTGVFGYGTVNSSAINIDGVVGYVQTQQSVGVVGWSQSSGTSAYGVYGYSATGPGVYGFNNNGGAASIYGYNTSSAGTAVFGNATQGYGVMGSTSSASSPYYGVYGVDNESATDANAGVGGTSVMGTGVTGSGPYGVAGSSTSGSGIGVFGLGFQGVWGYSESSTSNSVGTIGTSLMGTGVQGFGAIYGVYGQSSGGGYAAVYGQTSNPSGYGVEGEGEAGGAGVVGLGQQEGLGGIFLSSKVASSTGTALEAETPLGSPLALLGVGSGEAGIFYGTSGSSAHPTIVSQLNAAGTDYFAAINNHGTMPEESYIIQAASANYSGFALPTIASDVQMSGDLYVQGRVYQECSSGSGAAFPVTAPAAHCQTDSDLVDAVHTRSLTTPTVTTYSARQSLPTMEDFGEGQLVNGQASVPLERTFASTIDPSRSYLVFITPLGDCHGLYVAARSPSGFVVRELMSGKANVAFQYRIVAHPFADRATRLPAVVPAQSSHVMVATMPKYVVAPHMIKPSIVPPMTRSAMLAAIHAVRPMKRAVMPARPPLPHVSAVMNH